MCVRVCVCVCVCVTWIKLTLHACIQAWSFSGMAEGG